MPYSTSEYLLDGILLVAKTLINTTRNLVDIIIGLINCKIRSILYPIKAVAAVQNKKIHNLNK
jgi:hypothetical protein